MERLLLDINMLKSFLGKKKFVINVNVKIVNVQNTKKQIVDILYQFFQIELKIFYPYSNKTKYKKQKIIYGSIVNLIIKVNNMQKLKEYLTIILAIIFVLGGIYLVRFYPERKVGKI